MIRIEYKMVLEETKELNSKTVDKCTNNITVFEDIVNDMIIEEIDEYKDNIIYIIVDFNKFNEFNHLYIHETFVRNNLLFIF